MPRDGSLVLSDVRAQMLISVAAKPDPILGLNIYVR
jgi:hypothetical protein